MRSATVLVACVAVVLCAAPALADSLTNGDFETGDLTGWTATVPSGGVADALTTHAVTGEDYGSYTVTPYEGDYFAHIKTDGPGSYTTLVQQVSLQAGDVLQGYARYFDGEWAPSGLSPYYIDSGSLAILDSTNAVVSTPWSWSSAAAPSPQLSDWTYWSFTASTAGTYTLQFRLANGGDSGYDSHQYLDGVSVVPEPATLTLFALGIGGFVAASRRRRSQA